MSNRYRVAYRYAPEGKVHVYEVAAQDEAQAREQAHSILSGLTSGPLYIEQRVSVAPGWSQPEAD
jgi:hypothetical protein